MNSFSSVLDSVEMLALDMGARGGAPDTWQFTAIPMRAIRFDIEGCEISRSNNQKLIEEFRPIILSGCSGPRKMYILNGRSGSSLFKPNAEWIDYWVDGYSEIVNEIEVDTFSVADLGLQEFHLIKADIQGAELEVFKGIPQNRWDKVLAVEVESSFCEGYEGICLFPEVHNFMTQQGFTLMGLRPSYRFLSDQNSRLPLLNSKFGRPAPFTFMGQTNQADCFYLKIHNFSAFSISDIVRYLNICLMYRFPDGIELLRRFAWERIPGEYVCRISMYFEALLKEVASISILGIHSAPSIS